MAFVKVLSADALPAGQGMAVIAGGREYAVFNVDGAFHCIDNECPHREGPLAEGELEDDVVTCPWHAWQINVRTGEVLYASSLCVGSHACKVEDGAIWIDV
jgi:nitrite reductase/ring-hydroxylating ferredoxin subunit